AGGDFGQWGGGRPSPFKRQHKKRGWGCLSRALGRKLASVLGEGGAGKPAVDYAVFMQTLLPRHYPEVESSRLVQDNLNTHTPGSFYEVLPPPAAFALAQKFEPHYTPKKGSWLNMAEIEFAALSTQ